MNVPLPKTVVDMLVRFFGKDEAAWVVLVVDQLVYVMTVDDRIVTPESLERFLDDIGATPHFFEGGYCLKIITATPNLVLFAFFTEGLEQHTGETEIATGDFDGAKALDEIRHGARRRQ